MIDYIKYTIDGKTYELINNNDGTWSRSLNAPNIAGRYDLILEIRQGSVVTYIDSKDPRYSFYIRVIEIIEKKADLIRYLPYFMRKSKVYNEIFEAENYELDLVNNSINKAELDVFIRTASSEKIQSIEDYLKIKGVGSLEQRKNYLLALLQKGKKLNVTVIKEIANTITGSDCIVNFFTSDEIDNPNPGFGLLRVQVLSPDNSKDYRYDDIARALKPLIPEHIRLTVVKFYAIWDDIRANYADWTAIAAMTDWQAVKSYIPPQ